MLSLMVGQPTKESTKLPKQYVDSWVGPERGALCYETSRVVGIGKVVSRCAREMGLTPLFRKDAHFIQSGNFNIC